MTFDFKKIKYNLWNKKLRNLKISINKKIKLRKKYGDEKNK